MRPTKERTQKKGKGAGKNQLIIQREKQPSINPTKEVGAGQERELEYI